MPNLTDTPLLRTYPGRLPKNARRTLAAAAVAFALLLLVCAQPALDMLSRTTALHALESSEASITASLEEATRSQDALYERTQKSAVVYNDTTEFLDTIRPELLKALGPLTQLREAQQELAGVAALTVHARGYAVGSARAAAPQAPVTPTPTSTVGLNAQADRNMNTAEVFTSRAKLLRTTVDQINAAEDAIAALVEQVLDEAEKFSEGTRVQGFTKATAATRSAFAKAVRSLGDTKLSPYDRFTAFASAYDNFKASHDAAVAEEREQQLRLEAEQRAQEAAEEAAERARIAEEARLAEEEAARQAEEEAAKNAPPTHTPTPAPDVEPTPAPAPEDPED